MSKARILVVDDSATIRLLLREVLSSDAQLEVAGVAANGRIALDMISRVSPDLVILDLEMPELDGLETLKCLRNTHPFLPVIVFSVRSEREIETALSQLKVGVNDYLVKPAGIGSPDGARKFVREQLIPRIKTLCGMKPGIALPHSTPPAPLDSEYPIARTVRSSRIDVVAIGCSTGGPDALATVLPLLPKDFPVPVLVVQHMPASFTRSMAQRLEGCCGLHVREAVTGQPLAPGTIWIAPGDFHLRVTGTLTDAVLYTSQTAPVNSCRPSVDVLFSSLAPLFGSRVLAVVLTGMGQDGLQGCLELRAAGARIVVQDQATSVVWGMPGLVASANIADFILPLGEIGKEIIRMVTISRSPYHAVTAHNASEQSLPSLR